MVWMPTLSAANSRSKAAALLGIKLKGQGIALLEGDKLVREVTDIIHIIKDYDMILATGHLSPKEVFALVKAAKRIGLSKVIVTHALDRAAVEKSLELEAQQQLAGEGAFIEHCFFTLMPTGGKLNPNQMVEATRSVGAEHCIMSTDFGQIYHPPAPEGMRMFICTMLKCGLTQAEIELMVKVNPGRLLGLHKEFGTRILLAWHHIGDGSTAV